MRNFTKTLLIIITALPLMAQAAVFEILPSVSNVGAGESVRLEVRMDSPENVNAIEGVISFPADLLEVKRISEGSSVVSLWIDRPKVVGGTIRFSGAIPGGYPAFDGLLFSVDFVAKNPGTAKVSVKNGLALLNDGQGSEARLSVKDAVIKITALSQGSVAQEIVDEISPETFEPSIIEGDGLIGEGKYLVFSTQDKGAGIFGYEVFEGKSFLFLPNPKEWELAESPYLLKDQERKSWVAIRATDINNNSRIIWIAPEGYGYRVALLTITGLFIVVLVVFLYKRKK